MTVWKMISVYLALNWIHRLYFYVRYALGAPLTSGFDAVKGGGFGCGVHDAVCLRRICGNVFRLESLPVFGAQIVGGVDRVELAGRAAPGDGFIVSALNRRHRFENGRGVDRRGAGIVFFLCGFSVAIGIFCEEGCQLGRGRVILRQITHFQHPLIEVGALVSLGPDIVRAVNDGVEVGVLCASS